MTSLIIVARGLRPAPQRPWVGIMELPARTTLGIISDCRNADFTPMTGRAGECSRTATCRVRRPVHAGARGASRPSCSMRRTRDGSRGCRRSGTRSRLNHMRRRNG